MNFLEKQVDKANQAYLNVQKLQEQMEDTLKRLEIIELSQIDITKKVKLIESLSLAGTEDSSIHKKTMDGLFGKI